MSKFDHLVTRLLTEMPYIPAGIDVDEEHPETWDKVFDIELEKYSKDLNGLLELFKDYLQGHPIEDKHGNILQTNDHDEKYAFMHRVITNDYFLAFLRKYHNINDVLEFEKLLTNKAQS